MRLLTTVGGLLGAIALSGCQMLDSKWVDSDPAQAGATCHSNAGAYHLPRRLIKVTVTAGTPAFAINVEHGAYVADRNEVYCLDFLLSPTSADRVGIQRSPESLLQRVYTQADDKSEVIARKVIQGVADLVASEQAASLMRAGRPQFKELGATVLASFEFDPFVERETREVNYALSEFGYCVFLDARKDTFAPRWSEQICREIAAARTKKPRGEPPYRGPSVAYKADPTYPRSGLPIFDPRPVPREVQERGILYRPELSHSLVVVRRPNKASAWGVVASDRIVMPNAAPAFILEVERAIFVKAETDVQFKDGLIRNISINKPSELLVASNLAVSAAQIVVNIPKVALQIFNNRAENTIELMQTNAQLIEVLRQHKADVNLEAFGPAAAQAQFGTDLIFGRNARRGRTFDTTDNPAAARLAECLKDPAVQAYPDPLRVCQEIVNRGF